MSHRLLASMTAALLAGLLSACGPTAPAGSDGDGPDAGSDNGTSTPGDNSCDTAEQCPGGQVCDPAARTCVDNLGCDDHADCGEAAFCGEDSRCARSSTGSICGGDDDCMSREACQYGYCGCAGSQFTAEATPANILLVVDRSGSMGSPPSGLFGASKWNIAKSTIDGLLTDFADQVSFGLSVYPSDNSCGPGNVNLGVGSTKAAINGVLNGTAPDGATPIGDTLDGLLGEPSLQDPTRGNYVLLLTDGAETCSGNGVQAVAALRGQSEDVKTYVVGFGGGVDADALNAMADAGGTALTPASVGGSKYYKADDAAGLGAALESILGEVLSCTYTLDGIPEDAPIFVYLNGQLLSEGTGDGWTYDPNTGTLRFEGATCDQVKAAGESALVIVHGCPIDVG